MSEIMHDPQPDPRLREALDALDRPPLDEVDWDRLRSSVRDRAAMPLARRRRAARSGGHWLRPVLPAAAAAGLVLAIGTRLFLPGPAEQEPGTADTALGFRPVVEEVLGTTMSEAELELLFGQVSADQLVLAAVDP